MSGAPASMTRIIIALCLMGILRVRNMGPTESHEAVPLAASFPSSIAVLDDMVITPCISWEL
jgi:hypothetical protein